MESLALVGSVARFVLLLAGLLVPGAALVRALRVPVTVATAFTGSAVVLYATVLALQLTSIPISLASLALGLTAISAACVAIAWSRGAPAAESAPNAARAPRPHWLASIRRRFLSFGPWSPLYLLFWAATLVRLLHEPLSGPDLEFRWRFLAEQMLRLGTLDFYPPRSAADFTHYFWVESIPPGASALHAWAFACAGRAHLLWGAPAVLLQLWTIHALIWQLAEHLGGVRAARYACLAAAACPLLTWSVLLGQETGLTTVALVGIAFSLQRWTQTRATSWAALAGLFATLGAAAREYGLVFPVLAAVGFAFARADRRTWLAFAAAATLSLIWPLRIALLTGNPFYSLATLPVFPVSHRFLAWIEHDADALGGVLQTAQGWQDIVRYLASFALPATIGGVALVFAAFRRQPLAAWSLAAVVALLALWVTSVRYTNGGLFYSLRVTSPAMALGALAAGVALARWIERKPGVARWTPAVFSALMLAVAVPGALALPQNPWRAPPRVWPAFAPRIAPAEPDETLTLILRHAAPATGAAIGPVLADSPGFQRRFLPAGISSVPIWSPQADALFDGRLTPTEAAARWRASGIRYLIVTKWQSNLAFFNTRSRWAQPPFQMQVVGETAQTVIFSMRVAD